MKKTYYRVAITSMFAAIIFIATYLIKVPLANMGYMHVGDAFLCLAACVLPHGYALAATIVGMGLADILSGAAIWAPFTVVIKSVMVFCFTQKNDKILTLRNIFASVIAGAVNIVGYYFAEAVITGNIAAPVISLPMNVLQSVIGVSVFILLAFINDKNRYLKIK